MPVLDPYNEQVRSLFAKPVHAGEVQPDYTRIVRAHAAVSASGSRVELAAGLTDGRLAAVRFRVFGCPHLIALTEATCDLLEGQGIDSLRRPDVREIARDLDVPVEKTGLVLLLEDTLATLEAELREPDVED